MDVGPKRDLVGIVVALSFRWFKTWHFCLSGDLANAIRNSTDLRFGLYYSLFEWFNPLYLQDKANKWATQSYVRSKCLPELYEIVIIAHVEFKHSLNQRCFHASIGY